MNPSSTHSFTQNEVMAFKAAKELGIHRTFHAGEAGPAVNVEFALDEMCAERIGHGYSVIFDETIYKRCLDSNVHFELCPYSSYFTGSIPLNDRNLIVVFAQDNANFSISKDDPTVTRMSLDQEYEFCRQLGLNEMHITRANLNAMRAAFLPEEDKKQLLSQLYALYSLDSRLWRAVDDHHYSDYYSASGLRLVLGRELKKTDFDSDNRRLVLFFVIYTPSDQDKKNTHLDSNEFLSHCCLFAIEETKSQGKTYFYWEPIKSPEGKQQMPYYLFRQTKLPPPTVINMCNEDKDDNSCFYSSILKACRMMTYKHERFIPSSEYSSGSF